MPSIQTGVRGVAQLLEVRQVRDMADVIVLLEPSRYPLTTLLNKLGKVKAARNPKIEWMEDELEPRQSLVNGAQTAVDTTIEVDDGEFFVVGDVVHVPRTGENFRVTAIAGDNLMVVRGVGSIAGQAMVDDEPIVILAGAQREGDTPRTITSTLEVSHFNFTQILRTSFGTNGTQNATELYDGNDFDYQAAKKLIQHAVDVERILLFGQRSITTSSGQYLRTCGGLLERIKTNRVAINGVLSEDQLNAIARSAFRYGNDRKLALCSPLALQAFSNLQRDKVQTYVGEEEYGFNVQRYQSPFGELMLANHWLLNGSIYGGYMIVVDVDNLILRPLRGMDGTDRFAMRRENVQNPGEDLRQDEYLSEFSFQVVAEKTHLLATGIQG